MEPIFYFERTGEGFSVPDSERHHMEVLRINLPAEMLFTDGSGKLYRGRIDDKFKVAAFESVADAKKENVNIYFGICEKGRMKYILEKCTELGAASFTPVMTQKSDRYPMSRERADAILLSAIKQSRRFAIPEYREPLNLIDIPKESLRGAIFGAVKEGRKSIGPLKDNVNIIIGPPSGFTEEEEEYLLRSGAVPFYFDTAVLRTETFAVSLLSIIHYIKGAENE